MKKACAWIISVIMFLFALVGFSGSFLSGSLFLLGAIIANPAIYRFTRFRPKRLFTYSAVGVVFLIGCMCFPGTEGGKQTAISEPVVVAEQGATTQGSNQKQTTEAANIFRQTEKESQKESETVNPTGAGSNESLSSIGIVANSEETVTKETKAKEEDKSELTVHFIDVGQGDCSLLVCDGEAMLIDAGDNDKGTKVQLYLEKQGIKKLKYVIGTHPDADHIGGMDVILYKFDCENVIMPKKDKDTVTYRDVIDTMNTKGYRNTLPVVGDEYSLGGATFTIVGPKKEYDDSNDCSVAVVLRHGDNSFLFTGDAEAEAEEDIVNSGLDIDIDVYKVGHHGSDSSSGEAFLNAITPKCAVISCEEGNEYGHPQTGTLNRLRAMGVKVYRTDEQGSITVTSDGKSYVWNCSPSETWLAGERTGSSQPAESTAPSAVQEPSQVEPEQVQDSGAPSEDKTLTYMLNTSTKKFHRISCKEINKMAEKNKLLSDDSRESIIGQGYVPCKKCNP